MIFSYKNLNYLSEHYLKNKFHQFMKILDIKIFIWDVKIVRIHNLNKYVAHKCVHQKIFIK